MATRLHNPTNEYGCRICLLLLFGLLLFLPAVDTLLCYQCASGNPDGGNCQNDMNGMIESAKGDPEKDITPEDGRYTKNCTTSSTVNHTLGYCVIETFKSAGLGKSFIRDCSDGVVFSYTGNINDLKKLDNVRPDNETTCTYRLTSNMHVCVTLCTTDFCNGPQIPENNTNCTEGDNVTCSAGRPLWLMNSPIGVIFNPFMIHPLILPTFIYVLFTLVFC
ncbi:hypothetical protein SNE40_014766 [Patella caerulea]|uniref:Protein sleepless n=1 Tax=Patella caerulea TaxID=87958 RepID=A0AAN8PR15_PATCE